ncbi:MAG: hypothetical protein VX589_16440 [Myxococcota bacterium]|nr:hypothetical protein [Myxococcota bacterium]
MTPITTRFSFALALLAFSSFSHAQLLNPEPELNREVSQDVRNVEALKKLQASTGTVLVYARGLCCPSCSIGVRKKVSALAFVDTDKPKSGVYIDAKHQLVTIAVKDGQTVDKIALSKAVDDAGYPAVHLYTLKDGQLRTTLFASN